MSGNNLLDFSKYTPSWLQNDNSDLESVGTPQSLVARIEAETGRKMSDAEKQQVTDDMLGGMSLDMSIGARGNKAKGNPLDFTSYKPSWVDSTPDLDPNNKPPLPVKTEEEDTSVAQWFDRKAAEVGQAFTNFIPNINDQTKMQADQAIIKAGEKGGYYEYAGPDDTSGTFVPVSPEDVAHAKQSLVLDAAKHAAHTRTADEVLAGYPQSKEEKAYAEGRKDTSLEGTVRNMFAHKAAAASSMLTSVLDFSPTILTGVLDPGAGAITGAAQMAGSTYGESANAFLASKGIDPRDEQKVKEFYSDPQNVEDAIHYTNVHTAVMAGVAAALPGVGKATDALLPAVKNVAAETALKTAAHTVTSGAAFAAGAATANKLTGEETTGQEVVDNLLSGLPFALKDAAGFHKAAVQDRANKTALTDYLTEQATGTFNKAVQDNITAPNDKIDRALKIEQDRIKTEKAKEDAFKQAEQERAKQEAAAKQQKEIEQEAGFRTIEAEASVKGKTRLDKYGPGNAEVVPINPPAEVTPETVQAEREQAKADEAARLERVALGADIEHLRKRQEAASLAASGEAAKAEKAARTLEGQQRRKAADEVLEQNPGKDITELVPAFRQRLSELKAEAALPKAGKKGKRAVEAAQAATEQDKLKYEPKPTDLPAPTKADSELTDQEIEDLSRDSGMYIPKDKASMDMAGKSEHPTEDFPTRLHTLVRGLVDHTSKESRGVQELIRQRKLVIAPHPESIGRKDTGAAAQYDPKTGKMYMYTDRMDVKNPVESIIRAAHESIHLGQDNPRTDRGFLLDAIMGTDKASKAKQLIYSLNGKNKLATDAIREAKKEAAKKDNPEIENLELMAHFVGEAAKSRQGFGRLGGLVHDIRAGARKFLRENVGMDLDVSLSDLVAASRDVIGEAAKTDTTPKKTNKLSLDMVGSNQGASFQKAREEGRTWFGPDGRERYEIDDSQAKVKSNPEAVADLQNGKAVPISKVWDHPELEKEYPGRLDKVQLKVDPTLTGYDAFYDNATTVHISPKLVDNKQLGPILAHEVGHNIQAIEGLIKGTSSEVFLVKEVAKAKRALQDAEHEFTVADTSFPLAAAKELLPEHIRNNFEARTKNLPYPEKVARFVLDNFSDSISQASPTVTKEINRASDKYKEAFDRKQEAFNDLYKLQEEAQDMYRRHYGEAEQYNVIDRFNMPAELRKRVPFKSTLREDAADLTPNMGRNATKARVFREKGQGEIDPESYDEWRGWITGETENTIGPIRRSIESYDNGNTYHKTDYESDKRQVAFYDWASKAAKRYLDKYAGTPDDPLKDLILPGGLNLTWEEAMDNTVFRMPANNGRKEEFSPARIPQGAAQIRHYLQHVGDYMFENVDTADFHKYDLVRAIKETKADDAKKLKEAEKLRASKVVNANKGLSVYREYEDGMKWVKLDKPGAFAHESDIMGHSVRGYEPTKYVLKNDAVLQAKIDRQVELARLIEASKAKIDAAVENPLIDNAEWNKLTTESRRLEAEMDAVSKYDPSDRARVIQVSNPDWIPESSDSGQEYYGLGGWEAIKSGAAEVYSLRDKNGLSHATIEIDRSPIRDGSEKLEGNRQSYNEITQIKGKGNTQPAAKYMPHIQDFIIHYQPERIDESPSNYYDNNNSGVGLQRHHTEDGKSIWRAKNADALPKTKSKELPTLDMAAEPEPLKDRKDTPRRIGETEKQWEERIAKDNVGPLKKAFNALFMVDPQREHGRQTIVGVLAERDRNYTIAERQLSKFKTYFDKLTEEQRLKLNDDWENGREITDPTAKAMFETINPLFKNAIDYIKERDPKILKSLREFYLPHVWKKPSRAAAFFQSKGPLAGPKSFAKARRWPTMKEAMESGLEPVTTNPAELAMLKYGELLKYAGLLHMKEELNNRGWLVKADAANKGMAPSGWSFVRDPAFANTLVPSPIAKDLNNYLSRGLSDVPGFKGIRYLENLMVAGKLGWSGFHAGFTTMDNFVTHAEVASRRMLEGDIKGGLAGMLRAPLSIVQNPYEGGALIKRFLKQEPKTPEQAKRWKTFGGVDEHTDALLNLLEKGGARTFMDASEWNAGLPKMIQALRQKNIGKAAKYTLPAIADVSGWLIHRKLVPAQKMAARVLMLKFELDRHAAALGKEVGDYNGIIDAMHPDAAAQISRKVVNLIDDRLGHMSYDNQFWNAYAKHMAQLTIMAPGWVSGTFRTITGGLSDVGRMVDPEHIIGPLDKAGNVKGATFGRLTSRTANLVALTALTAAASGAFMYMLTGQWPQDAKDYVHPKTGRKNADGTDERISWPTYAKEHYATLTHPVKEVVSKLNQPLISSMWELLHNADFSNTEIFDPHSPISEQAKQIAMYMAEGFYKPISLSNSERADKTDAVNPDTPEKNRALRYAAMFGMTPAPAEIDQSNAEQFINDKYFASFPKETLSQDQKQRFKNKAEAVNKMRRGEDVDLGGYSSRERKSMRTDAAMEVYSKRFKGIRNIEDRLEAWDLATPEERIRYDMKSILLKNARTQIAAIIDPAKKEEVIKRINEIRKQ